MVCLGSIVRRTLIATACVSMLANGLPHATAASNTPGQAEPTEPVSLQKAAMTFPQPVRVGDLGGRYLLRPDASQGVLGRVTSEAVSTTSEGQMNVLIKRGGILGLGSTIVAVPSEKIALLGEHVVLVGLTTEQFAVLPASTASRADVLTPDRIIRMGIIGPFH